MKNQFSRDIICIDYIMRKCLVDSVCIMNGQNAHSNIDPIRYMEKNMKHKRTIRTGISLLLVLCMMLGVCPVTIIAGDVIEPVMDETPGALDETVEGLIRELVDYIYDEEVRAGYIDPDKTHDFSDLVGMLKKALAYYENTPTEQIRARAFATYYDLFDKAAAKYLNPAVLSQLKDDLLRLIDLLKSTEPDDFKRTARSFIGELKEKYAELIYAATHGAYVPNADSYYVALGGDTVYGTGLDRSDKGYYDLLAEALGLDDQTQYVNLGCDMLMVTDMLRYIEENKEEIAKADLITYQMDASSFIWTAMSPETNDWSRYFSKDEVTFIKQALPIVVDILENGWHQYADLDVNAIAEEIKAQVYEMVSEVDELCKETDKLDELLTICIASVKPIVEYIRNQAAEVGINLDAIDLPDTLTTDEKKFAVEAICVMAQMITENWSTLMGMSAEEMVKQFRDDVLGELENVSDTARQYIRENKEDLEDILAICADAAKDALRTARNKRSEVVDALNRLKPFRTFIEKLLYAAVAYSVDTSKTLDAIQAINPEAARVVVGRYNPLQGLVVQEEEIEINVGDYVDYVIDATNAHYMLLAIEEKDFIFVEVPDTEIGGFDLPVDVTSFDLNTLAGLLLRLNDSMYATADGHQYIFEQIMDALDTPHAPEVDNRTKENEGVYDAVVTFEDDFTTAVVACDEACVVLAAMEDGSYVRLTPVERDATTYTFDLSDLTGTYVLTVALRGDYNLDGSVTTNDVAQANRALVTETEPSTLQNYVFDMTGDDAITTNDVAKVNKSIVSETAIAW